LPLTPFPVDQFDGLNLAVDPTDLGMAGAVDLLNVDPGGRLRTRDKFYNLITITTTSALAASMGVAPDSGGLVPAPLISYNDGTGQHIQAFRPVAGNVTQNIVNPITSFAAFGDNTSSRMYMGSVSPTWRYLSGVFTQPAGMPTASYLAVSPLSNRLVAANISAGATMGSGGSRVAFSDAGAPETWTYLVGPPESGNFVDLTPGDGYSISGIATWQNSLFVFKPNRFFIFFSESTTSSGVVFNYRMVDNFGSVTPPVAGNEGVYFFDGKYVWVTTGGTPVRISEPIEDLIAGRTSINGGASTATISNITAARLMYVGGKLHVFLPGLDTASLWLVFDPKVQQWSVYSTSGGVAIAAGLWYSGLIATPLQTFLLWKPGAPSVTVAYLYPAAAPQLTISGTPVGSVESTPSWSYQTGYSSAGGYFRQRIISSGERKRHFKTDILGSGTLTHQVLALNARPGDTADPGGTVTLGTAPAVARGSRRRGVRGTYFAHKLSGTGAATVSGLTYWLANVESDT
jgi:hypothetical protein